MTTDVPPLPDPPSTTERSGSGPSTDKARRSRLGLTAKQMTLIGVSLGVVLILGGVIGAVVTASAFTPQIDSYAQRLTDADTNLRSAESGAQRAREERDVAAGAAKKATSALDQREKDVKAREDAVAKKEQQIAATSFAGGVRVVGRDTSAGVYHAEGSSSCYYVWKTGTDANADIIDNNIVQGPATVTLNDGDVFESSRCGTWTKVG
jgi:hypothetical protein